MPVQSQSVTLKVSDNSEMRVYAAKPAELSPAAGIMVFPEVFGVTAYLRSVTDRLAEHGYLALCPEIFHRTAPAGWEGDYGDFKISMPHYQALTNDQLALDAKASFDWLASQGAKKIGCVGFCIGGRISFLANATLPLQAAVSYYGGGIAPDLLPQAKDQKAPILFHWGGKDQHLTPTVVKSVKDALRTAGKEFISTVYSKADHAFDSQPRPNYHAESAELAWVSTIAFLKLHMSKP